MTFHNLYATQQEERIRMDEITGLYSLKPTRDPDFVIGQAGQPYMLRWWLIPRNQAFNIYYHQILRNDEDRALHDHPWDSFSVMITGTVREITPNGQRIIEAGDCVYRKAENLHRLELIDGPAETLFITGPTVREWGFACPNGWIPWEEFCKPDNPGEIGRGCGEEG